MLQRHICSGGPQSRMCKFELFQAFKRKFFHFSLTKKKIVDFNVKKFINLQIFRVTIL